VSSIYPPIKRRPKEVVPAAPAKEHSSICD
jgi:hypothetical protein